MDQGYEVASLAPVNSNIGTGIAAVEKSEARTDENTDDIQESASPRRLGLILLTICSASFLCGLVRLPILLL